MPNPVKGLGYINCYRSSRKSSSPSNSSDATVRRSAVDREDLKPYWKSEKGHIFLGDQQFYYLQKFVKDFTNHRNKTNRAVVFS